MEWFRALPTKHGVERIDHEAGIIFGVAVNTEGEAKGHGVHLDASFVDQVTEQGQQFENGLKARFGHPNQSGSSPEGTYLGRWKNFRTDQTADGYSVSRADLHLAESAKKAPMGNLYDYVLSMADHDPDMLGASIVFQSGETYGKQGSDKRYATLHRLHAADIVDEPAANPDGLFSEFTSHITAAKVTAFLDAHPEVWELLQNESIAKPFLDRYNANKGGTMPEEEQKQEAKGLLDRAFSLLGMSKEDDSEEVSLDKVLEANKTLAEKVQQYEADVKEYQERIAKLEDSLEELVEDCDDADAKFEAVVTGILENKLSAYELKNVVLNADADEVEELLDGKAKLNTQADPESSELSDEPESVLDKLHSIADKAERTRFWDANKAKILAELNG